jgi:hypothetical protein
MVLAEKYFPNPRIPVEIIAERFAGQVDNGFAVHLRLGRHYLKFIRHRSTSFRADH